MFKTTAAFLTALPANVGTRKVGWTWHTFTSTHGNKHAAIIEHARKIGASGWDMGNATHDEVRR